MSDAKKILAQKGEEALLAGRLFLDAVCGDGADLRRKVAAEAPRARIPGTPAVQGEVIDAEFVEDDDEPAPTVRLPSRGR